MKSWICIALLVCLNCVEAEEVNPSCHGQTPLELNYCTLISRGATGLPPLYEFRNNPAATQYLLLKRPAAKLGITLAAVPRPKSPQPAAFIQPQKIEKTALASPTPARPSMPKTRLLQTMTPSHCQLNKETISCGAERFQLQWNKRKNELAEGALAPQNQLQFPAPGPNTSASDDYLLQCYLIYIQKMLTIGLGNTTLSFGKFDGIFREAKAQGFDFAARFTRMYHFLKEERKTLQPPKGFGQPIPQRIDDCMKLSEKVWTCETPEHHWVFVKA